MQQILLAVLMAIVSLYQNPKVQSDPAMLAQVNQMFASITPLMQQASESTPTNSITLNVPTSTDNSQPIVINVTPPPARIQQTPAPVLGAAPEVVSTPESCTLTVKPVCNIATRNNNGGYHYSDCVSGSDETDPRVGQFTWTSSGIPSSTKGKLYLISSSDASSPSGMKSLNNEVLIVGNDVVSGAGTGYQVWSRIDPITQSQGVVVSNTPGGCGFQSQSCVFQLTIDRATCSASWTGVNPDGSQFVPQN